MKKLLFLIPNLKHGGAEKVLVNLVNNLDKSKFDITVYSIFDVGVNKDFLNSDITYRYKFKRIFRGNTHFFNLFSPEFLYRWFIKESYDVVISYLEGPAARIISGCDNVNIKKIGWIHTEFISRKIAAVGFRNLDEAKKLYGRFNSLIGVSKNVVSSFEETLVTKMPVRVMYNVNETEQIRDLAGELLEYEYSNDTINICSVGKITSIKGFDRLIEVHKKLIDEGYRLKTHLLGIGEEMPSLKRRVQEIGIADSFLFLGFHKNPYKFVSKCDLYICCSHREGFSTAVTEALVLGVPVLSTDVSGAKELLGENNEFGIVTENSIAGIYKGMRELLEKPEKLVHYKNQAINRGNMFSKENAVKAHEDFFDSLV
jgi:glycosyltransferase involved in cell wall biosynthesis